MNYAAFAFYAFVRGHSIIRRFMRRSNETFSGLLLGDLEPWWLIPQIENPFAAFASDFVILHRAVAGQVLHSDFFFESWLRSGD